MVHSEFIIAGIMLIGLMIYTLLGGADFGGGVWSLFARGPRSRQQQNTIANALAPVWEANHVWLILVIVLLFTAFPPAFAAIMTQLHIPMTLVLIGIVLRGSAFVFQRYGNPADAATRRWGLVFGIASLLTPFFLGICLGTLPTGEIQLVNGIPIGGFFAGWLTPFALSCGLFAQALFSFLAAVYLTLEAREDAELQDDFRLRGLLSGLLLAPIALTVFLLAKQGAPHIFEDLTSWWGPLLLLITSICALAALWGLWTRRYALARLAAAGQVALIILGWGLAQFPYLVVPDYTISNAATAATTLNLVAISLGLGTLILFPSLWVLFKVFKFTPQVADE